MAELDKEQVNELARMVGLELDGVRAETIASRLGAVLEVIDGISEETLAGMEPALVFEPGEAANG